MKTCLKWVFFYRTSLIEIQFQSRLITYPLLMLQARNKVKITIKKITTSKSATTLALPTHLIHMRSWNTKALRNVSSTLYHGLDKTSSVHSTLSGGGPRVVVSTAAFHARVRGSVPGLGGLKETKLFLPHPRVKVSIVGSLRDREVAYSASDRQGSNFESCVWRTVSSQSSHHPQEVLLAQFSLYVHKGGLKPDSFHFYIQPFQTWIYHCHLHPLQAANCCRNSRLVVDEDDLTRVRK